MAVGKDMDIVNTTGLGDLYVLEVVPRITDALNIQAVLHLVAEIVGRVLVWLPCRDVSVVDTTLDHWEVMMLLEWAIGKS